MGAKSANGAKHACPFGSSRRESTLSGHIESALNPCWIRAGNAFGSNVNREREKSNSRRRLCDMCVRCQHYDIPMDILHPHSSVIRKKVQPSHGFATQMGVQPSHGSVAQMGFPLSHSSAACMDAPLSHSSAARIDAPLSHCSAARFWLAYGTSDLPRATGRLVFRHGDSPYDDTAHTGNPSPYSHSAIVSGDVVRDSGESFSCLESRSTSSLRVSSSLRASGARRLKPGCASGFDAFGAPSRDAVAKARSLGCMGDILHYTLVNPAKRGKRSGVTVHSCQCGFPDRSVVRLSNGLLVCSPELTFVQMGRVLAPIELACFGMALCGIFGIDYRRSHALHGASASSGVLEGLPARQALTTKVNLRRFVKENGNIAGSKNAWLALRFMLDRSRSPMESITALVLAAPPATGGYGLPSPLLNCRIDLPSWLHGAMGDRGTRFGGSNPYAEADFKFSFQGRTVLLDYHGEWSHSGEANIHHDSLKANMLEQLGYPYLTITKKQVQDLHLLDKLVGQIQSTLGIRFRTKVRDLEQKRRILHGHLLELMSADLFALVDGKSGRR